MQKLKKTDIKYKNEKHPISKMYLFFKLKKSNHIGIFCKVAAFTPAGNLSHQCWPV